MQLVKRLLLRRVLLRWFPLLLLLRLMLLVGLLLALRHLLDQRGLPKIYSASIAPSIVRLVALVGTSGANQRIGPRW